MPMYFRLRVAVSLVLCVTAAVLVRAQLRVPSLPQGLGEFRRLPSLGDLLGQDPISTSLDDAATEVPFLDRFVPTEAAPILELPQSAGGGMTLLPGAWVGDLEGFCLQPGAGRPRGGAGYAWAPLKGPKAEVMSTILNRAATMPDVPQHDVQMLIWSILARTKVSQMDRGARRAAAQLLSPRQLASIDGSALDVLPSSALSRLTSSVDGPVRRVLEAQNRIREAMADPAGVGYEQIERIAVPDLPLSEFTRGRQVPRARWSYHPDGYFVQFDPESYQEMRMRVYVPEAFSADRDDAGRLVALRDAAGTALSLTYGEEGAIVGRLTRPSRTTTAVVLTAGATARGDASEAATAVAKLIPGNRRSASRSRDVVDVGELLAATSDAPTREFLSRAWASAVADWATSPVPVAMEPRTRVVPMLIGFSPRQRSGYGSARGGSGGWGGGGGSFGAGSGVGVPGGGGQRLGQTLRGSAKGGKPSSKARQAAGIGRFAPKFVTPAMGSGIGGFVAGTATKGVGFSIPSYLFNKIIDFNLDTWGAASEALGGDPPRDDFREFTRPVSVSAPTLAVDDGITPEAATRANTLLRDLMEANAILRAAQIALDRHGGAVRAGDHVWTVRQARAFVALKRDAGAAALRLAADLEATRADFASGATIAPTDLAAVREAAARPWSDEDRQVADAAGLTADDLALMKRSHARLAVPTNAVRAGEALDDMIDSIRDLGQLWASLPAQDVGW